MRPLILRLPFPFLLPACALLAAGPIPAQEPRPPADSLVPLELVEAFSFLGDGVPSRVLVGELPERLRVLLPVPPGTRTVGSLVRPDLSIGVLAVPAAPADARGRWTAILSDAGFEPWREDRPARGFVSTAAPPGIYCAGDSLSIHLGVSPVAGGGGSWVRLMVSDDDRHGACRFRDEPRTVRSPIPALVPPEGARSGAGGSGRGPGGWTSSARIATGLAVADLVAHYDGQLQVEGWSPVTALVGEESGLLTYTVVNEEGEEWVGIFTAVRVDEDTFGLEIRMVDSDEGGVW